MTKLLLRLGSGALLSVLSFSLLAEESDNRIEEVIVTAQRTAESIQDVPIAVTALTGDMLEERGVLTASDLQMNAPSLSYTSTNFGGYSFSIRGIGNLVIGGESGVSTHVNEIPVASNMNAVEFFDMERVEVLRGPQGTLFGRNATGGAVNFGRSRTVHDINPGQCSIRVYFEKHLCEPAGRHKDHGGPVQMDQDFAGIVGRVRITGSTPARAAAAIAGRKRNLGWLRPWLASHRRRQFFLRRRGSGHGSTGRHHQNPRRNYLCGDECWSVPICSQSIVCPA